jgi:hypothetical protein
MRCLSIIGHGFLKFSVHSFQRCSVLSFFLYRLGLVALYRNSLFVHFSDIPFVLF